MTGSTSASDHIATASLPNVEVAVGALIEPAYQHALLLIAQRPHDTVLPHYWELPGGKLEPNEDPESCVVREFHEELGLGVQVTRTLKVYQHEYDYARVKLHLLRCSHLRGHVQHKAVQAHRWVNADQLTKVRFPDANEAMIAQLTDLLRERQP